MNRLPDYEESLLREVESHPRHAEPRLVYADWLEERGDVRGEFLRHQVAIRRLKRLEAEFDQHQKRMRKVVAGTDPDWLRRIGYFDTPQSSEAIDLDQARLQQPLVVLRFFAIWSGPCRQMGQVMEQLAKQLAGWCLFLESDIDNQPELAQDYEIMNVPTIIVFRDGDVSKRLIGILPPFNVLELIDKAAK